MKGVKHTKDFTEIPFADYRILWCAPLKRAIIGLLITGRHKKYRYIYTNQDSAILTYIESRAVFHDGVKICQRFLYYLDLRGESANKGQVCGTLLFSTLSAWKNCWIYNRDDLVLVSEAMARVWCHSTDLMCFAIVSDNSWEHCISPRW